MKDSAFIIVNKNGIARLVKGGNRHSRGRTRPRLDAGEYAVLLSLVVPDKIFAPMPTPEATITVPESAIIAPRIDVSVETFDDPSSPTLER